MMFVQSTFGKKKKKELNQNFYNPPAVPLQPPRGHTFPVEGLS